MNDNKSAFRSDDYDEKIKQTIPYYDEFYEQVIDLVKMLNHNAVRWLDIGCGTGKMGSVAFKNVEVEKFVCFENFAPFTDLGKTVYLEKWKGYQMRQGKSLEECEKHIKRYGEDYFPISLSENMELMRNCGFRAVEILWLSNMQVGLWGIK